MVSQFTLPLTAEGSVTAPTGILTFTEPTAESQTFLDIGPVHKLEIPGLGWALADGVNPLRIVTRGGVYDAGGLAPAAAPTLSVSGATRATDVGTYTGQPTAGNTITLGRPGETIIPIWESTFVTDGSITAPQIFIGATDDDSYTNLYKWVTRTGTQGVNYYEYRVMVLGFPEPAFLSNQVEVSALSTGGAGGTITFRHVQYGAVGNLDTASDTTANFGFASANFTGGADGTGPYPTAGTRRFFYTWFRDADGAETGRSPIATITTAGNYNIAVVVTASADTTFDYIRIYSTTDLGVEFYLAGSLPRASATFTLSISDETLALGTLWNELLYRAYADGMPPRGRALALFKGRLWSLGAHLAADYTRGTVSVTNASATITFSLKGVTSLMRNRTFQVAATSEEYTILSVDESAATAVIDRVYEGTTNATASYTILDDYDACAIRASVQFLYNQWPVEESPGRIDTDDSDGGTALLATTSKLFAFSKSSIASITGEGPESWEISKISDQVGCVAPRMIAGIGDGCVFLSHDGIYALSPDGTLTPLSSPKTKKGQLATGIDGTIARINWSCVDQGYAHYDIEEGTIIFGVPLDGALVPNYEIVFDAQSATWTTFKRAEWTEMDPVVLPGGGHAMLSGDREGNLWHVEIGESDGFYGAEAVNTLTGAQTVRVLTASGAAFSTTGDGEAGKPVLVLYADGVTVAYGKVASNTGTVLTLAEDLTTAPAASDQIVLGGIAWQAKSGFPTFGEEYRKKGLRSVTVRHAPTTRGEYFLSFAVDGGSFSLPPVGTGIGSLSLASGKVKHFIQWPGDTHAVNLRGFKPGGRAVIRGGVFDIVVRENGTR